MTDEHPTRELVMPFVTVTSAGGPHDDDAYVAGWDMGTLDTRLQPRTHATLPTMLRTDSQPQADLVAMRHGYRLDTHASTGGWSAATLTRIGSAPNTTRPASPVADAILVILAFLDGVLVALSATHGWGWWDLGLAWILLVTGWFALRKHQAAKRLR